MTPYDLEKDTHLIYAFGHLQGKRMAFSPAGSNVVCRLVQEKRRYTRPEIISYGKISF